MSDTLQVYQVGEVFPEELPNEGAEGLCVKLLEGRGMWVLCAIDNPTNMEVNAFRTGKVEWGLLASHLFPWGLMLLRWRKSNGTWWTVELPFSVELETRLRPQAVEDWIAQKANAVYMTMVDRVTHRVVAIRAVGLPALLTQRLATVWKAQQEKQCDSKTYYRAYDGLCLNYKTEQLWNRAEVYHFVPHSEGR